jgi:cobalamin biosynthesis Mg chelatase CobN
MKLVKAIAAAIGLVLLLWGTGCRHAYQHHATANRIEQEHRQSQTVARAEEKQQQTGTVAKKRKRVREKFRRDGTLAERTTTTSATIGTWSNVRSGSSSASTTQVADKRTDASSSSNTSSSTSWWPPLWMWLTGAAAVVGVLWFLRWRARRLRLL